MHHQGGDFFFLNKNKKNKNKIKPPSQKKNLK
jgi:hypothetical protein